MGSVGRAFPMEARRRPVFRSAVVGLSPATEEALQRAADGLGVSFGRLVGALLDELVSESPEFGSRAEGAVLQSSFVGGLSRAERFLGDRS